MTVDPDRDNRHQETGVGLAHQLNQLCVHFQLNQFLFCSDGLPTSSVQLFILVTGFPG
jgi:hypothetical protein